MGFTVSPHSHLTHRHDSDCDRLFVRAPGRGLRRGLSWSHHALFDFRCSEGNLIATLS